MSVSEIHRPTLELIPIDIKGHIIQFLTPKACYRLMRVCRAWLKFISENGAFWKERMPLFFPYAILFPVRRINTIFRNMSNGFHFQHRLQIPKDDPLTAVHLQDYLLYGRLKSGKVYRWNFLSQRGERITPSEAIQWKQLEACDEKPPIQALKSSDREFTLFSFEHCRINFKQYFTPNISVYTTRTGHVKVQTLPPEIKYFLKFFSGTKVKEIALNSSILAKPIVHQFKIMIYLNAENLLIFDLTK